MLARCLLEFTVPGDNWFAFTVSAVLCRRSVLQLQN